MISDTEICNLALTKIGTSTILTLSADNTVAKKCNIVYEQTRDTVLREHNWSFATKIEVLAELANETVVGWDYLYVKPSKCLRIVNILDSTGAKSEDYTYKPLSSPDTNTPILATNLYQAYVEYIKQITNPVLFDSLFISAFVARLASELSMIVTGDKAMAQTFLQEYLALIEKAKAIDTQEKNIQIPKTSSYYEAR